MPDYYRELTIKEAVVKENYVSLSFCNSKISLQSDLPWLIGRRIRPEDLRAGRRILIKGIKGNSDSDLISLNVLEDMMLIPKIGEYRIVAMSQLDIESFLSLLRTLAGSELGKVAEIEVEILDNVEKWLVTLKTAVEAKDLLISSLKDGLLRNWGKKFIVIIPV